MPNSKSASKAMRHSARRREINLVTKNKFKSAVKEVKKAVSSSSKKEAVSTLSAAFSALDKAAKKGVIHKNTADRKKSRLAKAIAKLS